jgi:surface antigen
VKKKKMNETKGKVFGFVTVCLIAGAILSGLVLSVSADSAKYGQIIDEHRGVDAKSNGPCTAEYKEVVEGVDCSRSANRKYQCVEYVKRFYKDAMSIDTSKWSVEYANQYYGKASEFGLESYLNEGTVAPRADDILCFDNVGYGHVAIITGVDDNYVYIIEQNWNRNRVRENLPWNKATNKIEDRGTYPKHYWIQGWLRSPTVKGGRYLSADLNCDGSVNLADSAILMSFWGKDPSGANSCQSPDINQDGNVNLTDYAIMMSQWTR